MCIIFCYQWKASWLVTLFFKWETLIELILFNFIFKNFKLLKKIKKLINSNQFDQINFNGGINFLHIYKMRMNNFFILF